MNQLWSPKTMPKEAKEEAQVMPKKNQRVTKRRRLFCYRPDKIRKFPDKIRPPDKIRNFPDKILPPDKIRNFRAKSGMTVKTLG